MTRRKEPQKLKKRYVLTRGSVISFILLFPFLICAKSAAISWTIQTVDSSYAGHPSSLALDSSNKVHIAYNEEWDAGVKYATNASGTWAYQLVASTPNGTGYSPSLALDSSDKAHISFFDQSYANGLQYATNSSGSWVTTIVDSAADSAYQYGSGSIAVSSSDKVYISYLDPFNGNNLKYVTNASGSWATQTVEHGGGAYASIALDSSAKAYVSYIYWTGASYVLRYATNTLGSWVTQTVDTASGGMDTSLKLDSDNKAYISYVLSNGNLKYATNASGSWVTQTVDSTENLGFTSLALDSSNNAYISYAALENNYLKYATNASGSWVTTTVDSTGTPGYAWYTSIARDTSGNIHISYADYANNDLKYAYGVNYNSSTDLSGTQISLTDSASNVSGFGINFSDITGNGNTTVDVATDPNSFLADPMVGTLLSSRNISTTATFTGTFTIAFPYSQSDFDNTLGVLGYSESQLRFWHNHNGTIEDITTSVDTENNIVYGQASSFSDFGIGVNPEPATLVLLGSSLLGWFPFRKRKN